MQKASNLGDVKVATRKLFTRLMEQVFKEDQLVIKPKLKAPQEIEQAVDIQSES